MSVAVKAAAWAMLLRIFLFAFPALRSVYVPVLIFVSIATMTGANLAALTQNNLKRLLAYSSIAHVGYMLLGLIAGDKQSAAADGVKGILLYLLVYTFMNLGAFAVIASLRQRNVIGDEIDDIAGLFSRAPTEAVLMLIFLLSLAGIPPLAGFYGKYFIFLSLIETGHYGLASLAVFYAVFGLYYYMRIANAMFMRDAADKTRLPISLGMGVALGCHRIRDGLHRDSPRAVHSRRKLVFGHRAKLAGGQLDALGAMGRWLQPGSGRSGERRRLRANEQRSCDSMPHDPSKKPNPFLQIAKYSELAVIFPAATVVGWLIGAALDRWLHTKWLFLAGLILGIAAGFIELIRMVSSSNSDQ